MHQDIQRFQQTVALTPKIVGIFERHRVHSFIELTPITNTAGSNSSNGTSPLVITTRIETAIQCERDAWNVRFGVTYRDALQEPTFFVSLINTYSRSHVSLELKARPYMRSGTDIHQAYRLEISHTTPLVHVQRMIPRHPIAQLISAHSIELDEDIFWYLIDRIAIETNDRNTRATIRRRGRVEQSLFT